MEHMEQNLETEIMEVKTEIKGPQQVAGAGMRSLRAVALYGSLLLSGLSCGGEPSECCVDLASRQYGGCESYQECNNKPYYDEPMHCITDSQGEEQCCVCRDKPTRDH